MVIDHGKLEEHLQKLTEHNDNLEKLMTLLQKVQFAKAVSTSVLIDCGTPGELDGVINATTPADAEPRHDSLSMLVPTATVEKFCVRKVGDGKQSTRAPRAQLSNDQLRVDSSPQNTSSKVIWPLGSGTWHPGADEVPVKVIVEWRHPYPGSPEVSIKKGELVKRRDLIIQLLHSTSNLAGAKNYRVLDCFGYMKRSGNWEERLVPLIGFVSRIPTKRKARLTPNLPVKSRIYGQGLIWQFYSPMRCISFSAAIGSIATSAATK